MFDIALYEPEIPPNTGNLIRLCANSGFSLHLIHPLGFALEEKKLRRAGLDYREFADVTEHKNFDQFMKSFRKKKRIYACTTKATSSYADIHYKPGDCLLFGPETRGLDSSILSDTRIENKIQIPMLAHSRSINLANAVAIISFEAWRQNDFLGSKQKM